ncbi:transposase [Lutibacter sp. B2]|nr:transposase [Lutibacter sp. B2]
MPRTARIKSEDSMYHIMIRSISELKLYKENSDKEKYLYLIQKYQYKFGFKIYSYCLMDNHGHLLIDANGADVSRIMHSINQCYAQYFNRKYKRHGHVFQDRFKSKIINDDKYLLALSAYIHNNPKDIEEYNHCVEKYEYSTLGIYLQLKKDRYNIVDSKYILQMFSPKIEKAKKSYKEFINKYKDVVTEKDVEFIEKNTEYRSERVILKRDATPENIVDFVSRYTKIDKRKIFIKYNREATNSKALCAFLMRRFCDFSHKEICKTIGNITQGRIASLCFRGFELIFSEDKYNKMLEEFLVM